MDQNLRVGLDSSTPIVCESCGNDTFKEAAYLRKISKLLTGSPEDMVVPVPTFVCAKCGHVNESFQLKEAKSTKENQKIIN
jgi:uncharacterized Zn finger protein